MAARHDGPRRRPTCDGELPPPPPEDDVRRGGMAAELPAAAPPAVLELWASPALEVDGLSAVSASVWTRKPQEVKKHDFLLRLLRLPFPRCQSHHQRQRASRRLDAKRRLRRGLNCRLARRRARHHDRHFDRGAFARRQA